MECRDRIANSTLAYLAVAARAQAPRPAFLLPGQKGTGRDEAGTIENKRKRETARVGEKGKDGVRSRIYARATGASSSLGETIVGYFNVSRDRLRNVENGRCCFSIRGELRGANVLASRHSETFRDDKIDSSF